MAHLLICFGMGYFFQNGRTCKIHEKRDEGQYAGFYQQPPNTALSGLPLLGATCTRTPATLVQSNRGRRGGSPRVFKHFPWLKLVPSIWRGPVPPTSPHHPYQGAARGCCRDGCSYRVLARMQTVGRCIQPL